MNWFRSQLRRAALLACCLTITSTLSAQDRIGWITDLRQARDVAEREQRLVLLHFWSPDCAPCMKLDRYVFNQPELIRAVSTGYVPVKIDARQHPNLAQHYKIDAVPTDIVVTPEGREIHRATSPQDVNQYIAMLDGVRANASLGSRQPLVNQSMTHISNENSQTDPRLGQSPAPASQTSAGAQPIENRYFNALDRTGTPQEQPIAPRYANPYQDAPDSSAYNASAAAGRPTTDYTQSAASPSNSFDTGNRYAPRPSPSDASQMNVPAAHTQSGSFQPPPAAAAAAANRWQQERPVQQVASLSPPATQQPPHPSQSVANEPALDGYCPITLVENRRWTPGDKQWGAIHEGRVYLFAGPEQQRQFLANPHSYAPLLSGFDPVRYAETGQLVPGRREFGLYIDAPGPIALFADEAALQRFQGNADFYLSRVREARAPGQLR